MKLFGKFLDITLAGLFMLCIIAAILLLVCIVPFIFMLLWNYTIPYLFGLPELSFLQSFCIIYMINIIGALLITSK